MANRRDRWQRDHARRARVLRGARRAASATPSSATRRRRGRRTIHGVTARSAATRWRAFFAELFDAFPDWRFEVARHRRPRTTARRSAGAPARPSPGPGSFQGFEPNGARVDIEGVDLVRVRDGRDRGNRRLRRTAPSSRASSARCRRGLGDRGAHGQGVQRCARGVKRAPRRRRPSRSPTASGSCAAASRARTMNVYLVRDGDGVHALRRRHQGDDGRGRRRRRAARRHHARACSATATPTTAASRRGSACRCSATPTTAPTPRATAACATSTSPSSSRTPSRSSRACCGCGTAGRCTIAGTVAEGDEVAGFEVVAPARPRARADRPVARSRPPRARQRLLLHARSADRPPRPSARARTRRSTTTPSRRARRSASSPRWSRRPRGPATPSRSPATSAAQLERAADDHLGHGQARPRARQGREAQRPRERVRRRRRATCSCCAAR